MNKYILYLHWYNFHVLIFEIINNLGQTIKGNINYLNNNLSLDNTCDKIHEQEDLAVQLNT